MTLSKFLTYWSLTFAVLLIWIFSVGVAMADVKDELLASIHKQWAARAKSRLRPIDPLAGRSPAETLTPRALDEKESWVLHLVSQIAIALKLNVRILVIQDSQGHYLVHFAQGKRLESYRVDKTWVADAMAGKADQRERIFTAVEQCLRQEFLGEKPAPKPAVPAAPRPAAAGAATAPAAAKPAPTAGAQPGGAQSAPAAAPAGAEMSREEKIAAAKAKAEAIMAQRAAGGAPPSQPASSTSGTIASSAPSGSGAGETPPTTPSNQGGTPGGSGEGV